MLENYEGKTFIYLSLKRFWTGKDCEGFIGGSLLAKPGANDDDVWWRGAVSAVDGSCGGGHTMLTCIFLRNWYTYCRCEGTFVMEGGSEERRKDIGYRDVSLEHNLICSAKVHLLPPTATLRLAVRWVCVRTVNGSPLNVSIPLVMLPNKKHYDKRGRKKAENFSFRCVEIIADEWSNYMSLDSLKTTIFVSLVSSRYGIYGDVLHLNLKPL